MWSQIHSLRTPLDELREVHSDLADELARLSSKLENAWRRPSPASQVPSDLLALGDPTLSRSDEQSVAGRRLAREHTELLQLIRSKDGFQNFLHPKSADALMKAGEARAIACINVHYTRCDALIIFGSDMHVVRLPELSPQKIEEWHSKLTRFLQWKRARALDSDHRKSKAAHHPQRMYSIRDVLRELWYCVVKPILETYLVGESPSSEDFLTSLTGQLERASCTYYVVHGGATYFSSSPCCWSVRRVTERVRPRRFVLRAQHIQSSTSGDSARVNHFAKHSRCGATSDAGSQFPARDGGGGRESRQTLQGLEP